MGLPSGRVAAIRHEQRVSGSGRMIRESGAVMRPVELGHAFEVWLRLSAQRWHRPDADFAAAQAAWLANPKRNEGTVRREPEGADRWIDEFRRTPAGQVVELSRADLRNPDIHRSVPVRQKRHELTVARHRRSLRHSIEVRDRLESRIRRSGFAKNTPSSETRGLRQSLAQLPPPAARHTSIWSEAR